MFNKLGLLLRNYRQKLKMSTKEDHTNLICELKTPSNMDMHRSTYNS